MHTGPGCFSAWLGLVGSFRGQSEASSKTERGRKPARTGVYVYLPVPRNGFQNEVHNRPWTGQTSDGQFLCGRALAGIKDGSKARRRPPQISPRKPREGLARTLGRPLGLAANHA
jgi:hypothetical protein